MQKHLRMSKTLSNSGGESDAVRKRARGHPGLQMEAVLWPPGGKKALQNANKAIQPARPRSRLTAGVAFEAPIHAAENCNLIF